MKDNNNYKPRASLSYASFLRFEELIARAQNESFVLDPRTMGLSPHTFCGRFKEAIRGFCLYNYPTHHNIKRDYNWRLVQAKELSDGSGIVRIVNTRFDEMVKEKNNNAQLREKLKGYVLEDGTVL